MIFEISTFKLAKISSKILDTKKKTIFCRAVLSSSSIFVLDYTSWKHSMVRTLESFLSSTLVAEGNIEFDIWNGFRKNYTPPVLDQIKKIEEWLEELPI